jgi:glycyl-tRNA synthetase
MNNVTLDSIVSFAKRRGFIYPGSAIYGGFANSYTYGPYGVELKNNIKKLWWKLYVHNRKNIIGIDGPILLHPKVWEASGHVAGFNDALVDCKECKKRYRADHLIEEKLGVDLEGNNKEMTKEFSTGKISCPNCGKSNWSEVRNFNMMFKTEINTTDSDEANFAYLRPETAQAIFIEFKHITDTTRQKIPFGVAQIGKAFRNEIVAGNFIFRLREFEQMEIEYFISPEEDWNKVFDEFLLSQEAFARRIGANPLKLRRREHEKAKLSHYSQKTVDIEYEFPFGFKELFGLAHRSNFDLTQHSKYSGEDLNYIDPISGKKFIPHVIEPTFGLDRCVLVALLSSYVEEKLVNDTRIVLKFPYEIAPVKVAVFPLLKNRQELVDMAKSVFDRLSSVFVCEFDDNGNIGKRYRRQDEIGTPFCVTIDYETISTHTVTVRDRDSMKQERIDLDELSAYLYQKLIS